MNKELRLSVHELVDFLFRTGDIDNRIFNAETMKEGSNIHSWFQSLQKQDYISEYQVFEKFKIDDYEISLEGRADGVIIEKDNLFIDEIKSTIADLEEFYEEHKKWHLAQAICYGFIIAKEKNIDIVNIRLTYINQVDRSILKKDFSFTRDKLEKEVESYLKDYISFYEQIEKHIEKRNLSAQNIKFPFSEYRNGQKEMIKYSYGVIKNGGILFCEAPTGIGKTMSTIYPAIKSFASTNNDKIFYLTAKNSGKESAYKAVNILKDNGMILKSIVLTAKDKICFCKGKACNPDECIFAKGYYSKIKDAIAYVFNKYDVLNYDSISTIASSFGICPFEFQLDMSLYFDIIVCDYNYFFDPIVYLKRFFETNPFKVVALIDEAHNLINRAQGMYSGKIDYALFLKAKKSLSKCEDKTMKRALKSLAKQLKLFEEYEDGETLIPRLEQKLLNSIENFLIASSSYRKKTKDIVSDEFKDFSMELNRFYRLLDFYNDSSVIYIAKNGKNNYFLNLFCLDPSRFIMQSLHQAKSKIIFSATLTPIDYYIEGIGGNESNPVLSLKSPFNINNLCLMVAPNISTSYKNRKDTLKTVAEYIKEAIKGCVGNYFVYVPSYEYLDMILPYLSDFDGDLIVQEKDMNDYQRDEFLSKFLDKPTKTTIGLVILGGAFGEGVDLVSERLIGVVIVGVGLPQICYERNLIKDYFNEKNKMGYKFSYIYPGINKIMQAVGRVIRSETDRGIALLIDDRYLTSDYNSLFHQKWKNYHVVTSSKDIKKIIDNFWKD